MKATINFKTSEQAETFAIQWTRRTLLGNTVSNKTVSVYGITDEFKIFIDTYISQLNK
tara:strand:+ start:357 stop:530 length:174 start_codon:yes stop_codon:yes gene_type:complete